MMFATRLVARLVAAVPLFALACAAADAAAADFSVTPIRADLKPGAMSETLSVTNHGTTPLRVSIKLVEWSQDATGNDIYRDSSDLVYFPRQMEVGPGSKRLVRVGLKTPGGVLERTYRLFIEEEPELTDTRGAAQVSLYFRFGVPIFVVPAIPQPRADVGEPTLAKGKLSIVVKNSGNAHFRLVKLTVSNSAEYSKELQGWYSLAGSTRTYTADVPAEVCEAAKALKVTLEGEGERGIRIERSLNVDPSGCR